MRSTRQPVHDRAVTSLTIAEDIRSFFAQHEVASLRLPSGWFGRPHDNWHVLTEATSDELGVRVCLDQTQVLNLDAAQSSAEGRILRVVIRRGTWSWKGYGGDDQHDEVLGPGTVEFHAPSHP